MTSNGMPPATVDGTVLCSSPEGERMMAENDRRRAVELEREQAEYQASKPSTDEMLDEAIKEALDAGVSRAEVRAVLDREFAFDDAFSPIVAGGRLANLARRERAAR